MAELPRHAHRIFKRKNGKKTIYTYYTRHRNTPEALPSIRLPEPLSAEFSVSYAICEALEHRNGCLFLYGVQLPDVRDEAFWPEARKAYQAKERRDHENAKDFTALTEAFHAHEAFTGLAASTRRGYERSRDMVVAAWAFDLPSELTTPDAQAAIDALAETPATANQFRAYLSRLLSWGIPRGYSAINPVEHTEKIPGGEPWRPWPDWAFDILLEHAPFNCLMPAMSALFTGQRQSDVLPMQRQRKADTVIPVVAQKTGKQVWIPVHSEYRWWIDVAERMATEAASSRRKDGEALVVSTVLHLGIKGGQYTTDGFRTEWQRLMDTEPFKRFREERIVFHGLRKNAVINLLEVGCTESQVSAIVNMSPEMVRHYGMEVSTRRLAVDGMKLLEARWKEVRPAVLEQEQNANWKPAKRIGNRWERPTRKDKG